MPIISAEGLIVDILFWDDVFKSNRVLNDQFNDIPVVIMAGGIGSRLKPITNVIPKPLIPFGELPIIHQIMKKLEIMVLLIFIFL